MRAVVAILAAVMSVTTGGPLRCPCHLLALLKRNGGVAKRHELLKDVWGYGSAIMTRTVDTHIAELRRKLEANPAEPRHIVTVWKVGYRLAR